MSHERSVFGAIGENIVADILQKRGFAIKARNYKTKYGEIDIIACKRDLVLFIEVKIRSTHHFNLSTVVDYSKQKKIIRTALDYIWKQKLSDKIYRFDVALLEVSATNQYTMNYISNAFTASETSDLQIYAS